MIIQMKEDQLEKFIRQHREEFDTEQPNPQIWAEIDKNLDKGQKEAVVRRMPAKNWLSIAATLLLVLSIGFWLGQSQGKNEMANQWVEFQLSEQFNQSESYMKQLAGEKQTSLAGFSQDQNIFSDLNAMDESYEEQKQALLNEPGMSEEIVTRLMIMHYQKKIKVLEQMLETQTYFNSNQNKINLEDGTLQ